MIAPLSLTTRVVNSTPAGRTAQWMARLQHRISDVQTIAAFSLCPLRSWSTELRLQQEEETGCSSSADNDNNASKSLKIEQWTAMGSGGFVWGGSRRLAAYLRKNGSQGFRKNVVVTTTNSGDEEEGSVAAKSPSPSIPAYSPWAGLKVIELGAGTGALGLAIAAMGAHHVTLTDQAAFTYPSPYSINHKALQTRSLLDLMKWNVEQNKHHFPKGIPIKGNDNNSSTEANDDVRDLVKDQGDEERVQVREMLWGNDTTMLAALPHATYDVIVAADILLFESAQNDLLATLRHLSNPKTVIFIEHTDRSSTEGNTYPHDMLRFLELLARDTEVEWHPKVVSDHGRHLTICIERQ